MSGSSVEIAVVLRMTDGAHQFDVLKPVAGAHRIRPYVLFGSALRTPDWKSALPLATLGCLSEEVFLFVSGSLECVNHRFFEALVLETMRTDTGLVSGISIDLDGKNLHTGWVQEAGPELVDAAAGELFSGDAGRVSSAVRPVNAVAEYFFAVRREQLAAVGGVSALTDSRMQVLADRLAAYAAANGLRVVVTPFAVATFESHNTKPLRSRPPPLMFENP